MLHYPLRSPRPTHLLLQLKLKKLPVLLSGPNTSVNMFIISYKSPKTSTSSSMINTGCHISFRWVKKFGFTCRKNALQDPIRSFYHFVMGRTPSPRLWVIMFSISTFLLSLAYTQCSAWISFDRISHHYWMPQR
jgi:hypothetical protein